MQAWALRYRKTLAVLCGLTLMLAMPVVGFLLRNTGPAARVVYYVYLPLVPVALYAAAALLGAAIGFSVPTWLLASGAPQRKPYLRLAGLALFTLWAIWPQLFAFPAGASLAERDAWARAELRNYPALTRVVGNIPELRNDLGAGIAMAPTSSDEHRIAQTMDGDEMSITFELVGPRGRGTLSTNCTLDDYNVYDWREARWRFGGKETRIAKVAPRVPAP